MDTQTAPACQASYTLLPHMSASSLPARSCNATEAATVWRADCRARAAAAGIEEQVAGDQLEDHARQRPHVRRRRVARLQQHLRPPPAGSAQPGPGRNLSACGSACCAAAAAAACASARACSGQPPAARPAARRPPWPPAQSPGPALGQPPAARPAARQPPVAPCARRSSRRMYRAGPGKCAGGHGSRRGAGGAAGRTGQYQLSIRCSADMLARSNLEGAKSSLYPTCCFSAHSGLHLLQLDKDWAHCTTVGAAISSAWGNRPPPARRTARASLSAALTKAAIMGHPAAQIPTAETIPPAVPKSPASKP